MKKVVTYFSIFSAMAVILLASTYYFLSKKEHQEGHFLILSSGSEGSPYFENAKYIEGLLNSRLKEHKIINLPSEGSHENFQRLQNKTADLIIAQRDVIIEKYYSKDERFKSFEILMPLFPEAFQILVRDPLRSVISYQEFNKRLELGAIKSLGIGPSNSTTNRTFQGIRNILGLSIPSSVQLVEKPLSESITDFEQGNLDAVIYFSAPPIKTFDSEIKFALVSFEEKDISLLLTYFKDLESTSFSSKLYFKNSANTDINTLGTWAFLICSTEFENSSEEEIVDSIPNIIANNILTNKPDNQITHAFSGKLISLKKDGDNIYSITAPQLNASKFFMNIPLTNGASTLFGIFTFSNQRFLWLLTLGLLALALIIFKKNQNIELIKWRERYGQNVYVLLSTVIILMCLCYIIRGAELLNFYKYGVKSPILNLRFKDTFEWLTIFVFTHHDSHIFPITTTGAIAASSAFILGSGAVLSSIFIQILQNDTIKKRAMGELSLKLNDHIVICGWNNKTANLAINLVDASIKHGGYKDCKVVLLNTVIQDFESKVQNDKLHELYHRSAIEYCNGEATDSNVLQKINLHRARTVIIVSEGKNKKDDEKVLLSAYAIGTYCKEINKSSHNSIYVVAEVTDPEFIPRLEKADVNVIISTGELVNNLIIQDTICRGIYNPIRSLISYSDSDNDFYNIRADEYPVLLDKTFDELQALLRTQRLQLIGFKKVFLSGGAAILDKELIETYLKDLKIKSEYIINPQDDTENEIRTENNDEIILLSMSKKDLNRKLKQIRQP